MRIEDLLVRHLPHGGRVLDMRAGHVRDRMSLDPATDITIDGDSTAPADVALIGADTLGVRPPVAAVTVVQLPAHDPDVAAVLAWATEHRAQVVELVRTAVPAATVAVVRHDRAAQVPAVPAVPDDLPGDDLTWKRLAGELVIQRHRTAALTTENEDLRRKLRKARRNVAKLRE